jgi:hypothetical protein
LPTAQIRGAAERRKLIAWIFDQRLAQHRHDTDIVELKAC